MWRFLSLCAVLMLGMVLVGGNAEAAKGKKKKAGPIVGTILNVEMSKDATDEGTLTIKTSEKKKKGVVVQDSKEEKVQVKKDTKIERAGKKKAPPTAAAFSDVQTGQQVSVTVREAADGKIADRILIQKKKKKAQ